MVITQKVIQGVYPGVTTGELDELAAQTAAYMSTQHPDFSKLAARISVSNLHKSTEKTFSVNVETMKAHVHPKTGDPAPLVSDVFYDVVMANKDKINSAIIHDRDFDYDYFGFKTLERGYLVRLDGKVLERPQHMIMRVAVGIHGADVDAALETYELMSQRFFTHATPTLFNAGSTRPQLSSCFLLSMTEDSIEGIYDTLKRCACISKYAGGIGLAMHNIRATDSYIRGSNGTSNGIVPMLRVYNDTARYVDQGGGKRKGSFAVYLEPWHADIFDFLKLKLNHGNELERARDLFYALWIPDLFMERVKSGGEWSLFCPNEAPGLADTHSAEFKALYEKYESEGRARKTVPAQTLWFAVLDSQVETGTPYMLFKDHCNSKSNQQNLGTIKCSNLCTEIVEYTSPDEVAVCNLASINLAAMVVDADAPPPGPDAASPRTPGGSSRHASAAAAKAPVFDFARLHAIAKVVCRNLNKVIDINYYPIEQARNSNVRHRPIGIGVQGLADAFIKMRLPFESAGACALNRDIFETIYHGAVEASVELARKDGPYQTFAGSPASQGKLQFDLWGVTPTDRWDWATLKAQVVEHGLRNSLLLAPMPTASTAQILGNNESFEPYTSNMFTRRVLAGEFTIVNKYLLRDLVDAGLWSDDMRNEIIADRGSVQAIKAIPEHLKQLYKTVWEISQKVILNQAADRGAFICQSQSLNVHMAEPNPAKLTSMHFYAWQKGLKTGMYYLRTRPKADAIQFTVDQKQLAESRKSEAEADGAEQPGAKGASPTKKAPSPMKEKATPLQPQEEEICLSCGA